MAMMPLLRLSAPEAVNSKFNPRVHMRSRMLLSPPAATSHWPPEAKKGMPPNLGTPHVGSLVSDLLTDGVGCLNVTGRGFPAGREIPEVSFRFPARMIQSDCQLTPSIGVLADLVWSGPAWTMVGLRELPGPEGRLDPY